jgi:hypothetical protein
MTVQSANRLGADRRLRWSGAGGDGGCPVRRHTPQFERHSHDNRTCQGNPQPHTHPIGSRPAPLGAASFNRAISPRR